MLTLSASTFNLIIISHPGSAGVAFAGSTCALASIREKDDYKNWAFGGAVAGSIFGIQGWLLSLSSKWSNYRY